jgi:hypothetical protein
MILQMPTAARIAATNGNKKNKHRSQCRARRLQQRLYAWRAHQIYVAGSVVLAHDFMHCKLRATMRPAAALVAPQSAWYQQVFERRKLGLNASKVRCREAHLQIHHRRVRQLTTQE